jgi:predicted DNA-binding transcriptional regulator AlpA
MQPRLIRFRDAPRYLGMDRNRFNIEVRPRVTEVRIGRQGVAFDRLELDAWVDDYLACNGRPLRKEQSHGTQDNTRPHHARRDLAYRQTHRRAARLPKH